MKMKFNLTDYKELCEFRCFSYSSEQDDFLNYLNYTLQYYNFETKKDRYGNLIANRGISEFKPLIIAHVDINQQDETTPEVIRVNDWIIGINPRTGEQAGIGHDDKAGIYFALQIAKIQEIDCKIIFVKDEEVGCLGTNQLSKKDLKGISFAIQLDRKGHSDVSKYTNGVNTVSNEFMSKTKPTLKKYGMKFVNTIYTDVGALKADHNVNFCCINVSAGYYNEHRDNEKLHIKQLENCMLFGLDMILLYGTSLQLHKYERPAPVKYSKSSYHYESWYKSFKSDKVQSCDFCGSNRLLTFDINTHSNICKDCNDYLNDRCEDINGNILID